VSLSSLLTEIGLNAMQSIALVLSQLVIHSSITEAVNARARRVSFGRTVDVLRQAGAVGLGCSGIPGLPDGEAGQREHHKDAPADQQGFGQPFTSDLMPPRMVAPSAEVNTS